MGDVTSGSRAHIQIFSPGGQYYIGDGFSAWISGDQNTIITFNLLDGFKVENIEAIERTGAAGTASEADSSGLNDLVTPTSRAKPFPVTITGKPQTTWHFWIKQSDRWSGD